MLAGMLQTILGICDRKREAEAVLTAIASEVDSICRLVRHQRYLEGVQRYIESIEAGSWQDSTIIIDIRGNYFSVYEGVIEKIGLLTPDNVAKIVNFYAYCKSVIDSTRPDGPVTTFSAEDKAGNLFSLSQLLKAVLSLGDEIVRMPKHAGRYLNDNSRSLEG